MRATYVPDRELHARHLATDVTRFGYAEIAAAAQALDAAAAAYDAVMEQVGTILAPYDRIYGTKWIDDDPDAAELDRLVDVGGPADVGHNVHSTRDLYPVNRWRTTTRRYRRATSMIERALARCNGGAK